MGIIDAELKEKIIQKFEKLDAEDRLELVKKIGIPDYVWQCINYQQDAPVVVDELIQITEYNTPELMLFLRKLVT